MKNCLRTTTGLTLILATLLAAPNLLPAQETAEEGWTDLFNGKDFTGFRFFLGGEGAGNDGTYTIEDGVIICRGKPSGYMYTEKSYGNYTLQFEFAFKKPDGLEDDSKFRGNSGCLIHVAEPKALGVWPRSIEVQGMHRQLGLILPIPRSLKCERTFDGAVRAEVIKPVGEFNQLEIKVEGGDLDILLNGKLVSTVRNCELTEGPIGFQSEGVETHWKNIRIREK